MLRPSPPRRLPGHPAVMATCLPEPLVCSVRLPRAGVRHGPPHSSIGRLLSSGGHRYGCLRRAAVARVPPSTPAFAWRSRTCRSATSCPSRATCSRRRLPRCERAAKPGVVRKLPGETVGPEVVVRRSVRTDDVLWDWYSRCRRAPCRGRRWPWRCRARVRREPGPERRSADGQKKGRRCRGAGPTPRGVLLLGNSLRVYRDPAPRLAISALNSFSISGRSGSS